MGKMWNCGVQNEEGKRRNGMCGATVIGCDVTSRDCSYSAFHRKPCDDSMEVKCILSMRKVGNVSMPFGTLVIRCSFVRSLRAGAQPTLDSSA